MARPKKTSNAKGDTPWVCERLLDAAEHLFASRGYEATSLRDIGLKVGVSNATLLHHFGSKLALYRAVLDRLALALETLVESVESDDSEPATSALSRFLERFREWTHQNPNYGYIAFREFMDRTVRESRLDFGIEERVLQRVAEFVRRGQRAGAFRADVDAETYVIQLLTTVWLAEVSTDTWALIANRDPEAYRGEFREQSLGNLMRSLLENDEKTAAGAPAPALLQ